MSDAVIKVAITSPYPLVVEGLTAMLGRHPDRVEIVPLPATVGDDDPDVVLYDVMEVAERPEDLPRLIRSRSCAVVLVARDTRPDLLAAALGDGADAFVSTKVAGTELLATVESAAAGTLEEDQAEWAAQRARLVGADLGLSARESWALSLIVQGLTNQEIADRGFLSINTVKTYIRTAYRKIGVRSRSQAVAWALTHGYPDLADTQARRVQ